MPYTDLQQQPKPIALFDMDGTLLDLAFDDFIWNQCLPERYAQVHQCSLEQSRQILFQFYKQHQHTLAGYSSVYCASKLSVDVVQLQYEFRDKISARLGCHALLKQLNEQGFRCWLLTNSDRAGLELKLEQVELSQYFELMISSEDLGHAKEDISFWQKLHQMHPFVPAQAVFVDDTVAVLKSAEEFGISQLFSILQPSSTHPARVPTEIVYPALDHLTELFDYLESDLQLKDSKTA